MECDKVSRGGIMSKENLITSEDVAELLKVSAYIVRKWAKTGKIPAIRVIGQFRFRRSEIETWLESHRIDAT